MHAFYDNYNKVSVFLRNVPIFISEEQSFEIDCVFVQIFYGNFFCILFILIIVIIVIIIIINMIIIIIPIGIW